MNLDMDNNQFAVLYEMYATFQASYYGKDVEPILNMSDFKHQAPLIIFDCSKQNESLKYAPVDVRFEFETSKPVPPQTMAYCLIIHDKIIQYKPISGDVRRMI